tara:strand:+ start:403 stop:633 length:231 start_codon:yes stop_codon:yes gene_type:complete
MKQVPMTKNGRLIIYSFIYLLICSFVYLVHDVSSVKEDPVIPVIQVKDLSKELAKVKHELVCLKAKVQCDNREDKK